MLPHGLLFLISSKCSFICIMPQTMVFVTTVVEHGLEREILKNKFSYNSFDSHCNNIYLFNALQRFSLLQIRTTHFYCYWLLDNFHEKYLSGSVMKIDLKPAAHQPNTLHHRADLHHNVLRKSWNCATLVLVTPYTTEQTYITMS